MTARWMRNFFRKTILSPSHTDSNTEDESEGDPFNPFPEPVQVEIADVIDLHTIAPRDVKRVIEEYLYQAHQAGFRSVRIIHGKGIGVQRDMLRTILARTPFVADWTDAPPQAGGLGATVVMLSRKDARKPPV